MRVCSTAMGQERGRNASEGESLSPFFRPCDRNLPAVPTDLKRHPTSADAQIDRCASLDRAPDSRGAAMAGQSSGSWPEVLRAFLKLGLTSFGGPVAHLGYFRAEFVARRAWLTEPAYADIVALCQFLPGPASSQVGIGIGLMRAGIPGALAAWTGFTLPSALAMVLFAYGVDRFAGAAGSGWLHGLKIAAVAVVAQAVWGMAQSLCPDRERATLAVLATIVVLTFPTAWGQVGAIALGALAGLIVLDRTAAAPGGDLAVPIGRGFALGCLVLFFVLLIGQVGAIALGALAGLIVLPRTAAAPGGDLAVPIGRGFALACLVLFFGLLIGLPSLAAAVPNHALELMASFYRSGSLVFGGGHVVLPLLQASVVPPGWITDDAFLAGYGAAQAVPGPLFTFAAYLGAAMEPPPNGWAGAIICLVAVFLPSFLLVFGALPFWAQLRERPAAQTALRGVNAAVVGLLLAALYRPVWTSAILGPADFALAVSAFLLLAMWRTPPWLVVVLAAVAGPLIG